LEYEVVKNYIVDEKGEVQSVVIDYESFKKFEELIEDYSLGQLMYEDKDDAEYDITQAMKFLGIGNED
jgi:hypothetical protein